MLLRLKGWAEVWLFASYFKTPRDSHKALQLPRTQLSFNRNLLLQVQFDPLIPQYRDPLFAVTPLGHGKSVTVTALSL